MPKTERAFDYDEPRFQKQGGVERKRVYVGGKAGTQEHVAVREPDALERMYSRGNIDRRQHDAATAWATDFERAGMGVVVCASYGGAVAVSSEAEPERRRMAKERFREGYRAMTKPSVVWALVIDNVTLKDWSHNRMDPRTAKNLLGEGLNELAAFYGIPKAVDAA